jgi:signal transduction histidine kinase
VKKSIRARLATGFGICVLLMVALVAYDISCLQQLERLYHQTLRRSSDMEAAADAQHLGQDLYLVIANAVINRNLADSEGEWAGAKARARAKLARVAAAADCPLEHAKIKEAGAALDDIVDAFERELLPLLRAGAAVPGRVADIDARIDGGVEGIGNALKLVARSMSDDNTRVSREFHAVLSGSITVSLVSLLLGLIAAWLISALTTRGIVKPLKEITDAAREMERGNYLCELRHFSQDETGVLAGAFRNMAQRVAGHTRELQRSNERLNREIGEREQAQKEICRLNAELERRVEERTAELTQANEQCREVIAAQQRAEAELQRSRAELRSLSGHLQEARESERAGIAREIHDELGQMLTAMKMELSWLTKRLPQGPLVEKTAVISGYVDSTIGTVQRISAELRPGILDDLGLAAALEWQAQDYQKKTGIRCEVRSSFDCGTLERRRSTALFRIFQETLTNIYRHAGATSARVTIEGEGDLLVASVEDNGRGVTEEEMASPASLGLIGMRERVGQFGGEVTLSRVAAGGTLVRVTIPLTDGGGAA